MEHNPYQTPDSTIIDVDTGAQLATRSERLAATLLDGLIALLIVCSIMFATGYWQAVMSGQRPGYSTQLLYSLFGFVVFILVQGYPLGMHGQTWGKRAMKIRIVDLEGRKPSLTRLIINRYLPIQATGIIPILGNLLALADVLMIFRADYRCGHDLIAGTRVVKAD